MTVEPRVTRRFVVSGRVQGVGYRMFAARCARSLGLAGGASNLDDGRVLVVASGPLPGMERFEGFLWQGPRFSRVDRVEMTERTGDASALTEDGLHDVTF